MKKLIIFIFIISLGFTSCITQKKCNRLYPPKVIVKDSIIYKTNTIYKDTTLYVYLPADTVYQDSTIYVYLNGETGLMNSDTSKLSNRYATALAWVEQSELKQLLIQNEQNIEFSIDSAVRVTNNKWESYHSETKIEYVQYTAWYDIGSRIIAVITLLVILIWLIAKIGKMYLKTIKPF